MPLKVTLTSLSTYKIKSGIDLIARVQYNSKINNSNIKTNNNLRKA